MREPIEDVTLTAYALGELPETERQEIAARIAASPELRREVAEIQATASALQQTLAARNQHALTPGQRSTIEAEASRPSVIALVPRRVWLGAALAAAALVLVALAIWRFVPGSLPSPSPPSVVARTSPSPALLTTPTPARVVAQTTPLPTPPETHVVPSPPVTTASAPPVTAAPTSSLATATIAVRALDPAGAPIPGAQVSVVAPASGLTQTTTTNAAGEVMIPRLEPGAYRVEVTAPGFETARLDPVQVAAGDSQRLDARLHLGSLQVTQERAEGNASLSGTVKDQQGGIVFGATVTLTSETQGSTRTTTTNTAGHFVFPVVRPDTYTLKVSMAGFKVLVQNKVAVGPNDKRFAGNLTLEVGQIAEAIIVSSRVSELQAASGERSYALESQAIRSIASSGRSLSGYAVLVPGVVPVSSPSLEALRRPSAPFNTEAYDHLLDNPFVLVAQDPRSTFSVDVDTASYAIVRRFLNDGELPPKDAVRIEELVNYFSYAYAPPADGRPFAAHMDVATCPWQPAHRLVRVAIKARELSRAERPPANLVFLLDVSGSMDEPNKLPLVQAAMKLLVGQLQPRDRVAIVVYAGAEGLALPSTSASDKATILSAIDSLSPGGTTHGSAGLRLAYETAKAGFIKGGVNRVILATDGDFNVGVTNEGELVRLIQKKAKSGVFLTTLGFGTGNLKDSTLEKLADLGNGNYAYIDGLMEARKVLVQQVEATLVTIAKDVKLQIEFNPAKVQAFRLIGYENRVLAHQDFNDDKKDAGDIGAGHTVTAFYEIVPPGEPVGVPTVDPLKYQTAARPSARADSREILTLKLRYKQPDAERSARLEVPLEDHDRAFEATDADFRFAAAVAAFGMILRDSPHKGEVDLGKIRQWADAGRGADDSGLRSEFVRLVEIARSLASK